MKYRLLLNTGKTVRREVLFRRKGLVLLAGPKWLVLTHEPSGKALGPFNGVAHEHLLPVLRSAWLLTDTLDWREVGNADVAIGSAERGQLSQLVYAVFRMAGLEES